MTKIEAFFTTAAIYLSTSLISFPLEATVSDFDYIDAWIAPLRGNFQMGQAESPVDEKRTFQSFAQIVSVFRINPIYKSSCFTKNEKSSELKSITSRLPVDAMDRTFKFLFKEKEFGFAISARIEAASVDSIFVDQFAPLKCSIKNSTCAKLTLNMGPELVTIEGEELTKEEEWVLYLTPDGELLADASYSLSKSEKTWLGANKGTISTSKDYVCYLEKTGQAAANTAKR